MAKWTQDHADYSWHTRDAHGVFYRASRAGGKWVVAWQEQSCDGLRIGSRFYSSADEAKEVIEGLACELIDAADTADDQT